MQKIDKKTIKAVSDKLISCITSISTTNCSVAFSGGIDSTLVAFLLKKYSKNVKEIELIYAGMEDKKDHLNAQSSAKIIKLPLKQEILSEDKILEYHNEIKEIIKSDDLIEISYLLPYYAVLKSTTYQQVLTGQGSDELFMGYHKFTEQPNQAQKLSEEMYKNLKNKLNQREYLLAKKCSKEVSLPFVDKSLGEMVLPLDIEYKLQGNLNKVLLREVARYLGLPDEIAMKPKKAAQYGSGIWKVLKKNKNMLY